MSFFKELKEDIAQSVNELTESLEEGLSETPLEKEDGTDNGIAVQEKYPEEKPEEKQDNLDAFDEKQEAAIENEPEPEVEEADNGPVMEEIEETEEIPAEDITEDVMDDIMEEETVVKEEKNQNTMDMEEEETPEVTVITKGTTINGGIKSDTSLVVKGTIEGDVECQGKLTITGRVAGNTIASEIYVNTPRLEGDINSKGIVKIDVGTVVIGNVNCTSVVVAGAVKGSIEVNGPVVVDSTAVVKGDIKAKSIQINSGAVIDGHCSLQFADVDLESFFA